MILFGWVSSHLIEPLEIGLVLYFLEDLMHRFLEYQVDHLCVSP